MVRKEFFKQIEIIAEEKGINVEDLYEAFRKAMVNAFRKMYGNSAARIEIKPARNEILIYSQHLVVKDYIRDDPTIELPQMLLSEAKALSNRYKVGDVVEQPISPEEFGRIAASTAKQVFNQNIRNFEKENAYNYFKQMENEMIIAEVVDIRDDFLTLSVGENVTTLLPKRELLPNDTFVLREKIKVYITAVEPGTKGPKVFVSRNDKNLVTRLMENVIPEIKDGTIEIMGLARDPGDRTKIAIYSKNPKVDAIGSCVGEAGCRIREVVTSLNGEKIDLYKWSEDPKELITNALQPAHVLEVIDIDVRERQALAIVPDDQLSLAIGKAGQNVRLAVMSSGWKIDIKSEEDAINEEIVW
ncbi:MAG: transcription termination factor NusA [Erysipelotrichales bacterium]|nr:transcription termination factor NusA [Erysipelotrichales bacterium]